MCKYCEEVDENWTDTFEGVKHYRKFEAQYEKDSMYYHKGTHIYETNGRAVLDVESFSYLINYCPMCGRKLGEKNE